MTVFSMVNSMRRIGSFIVGIFWFVIVFVLTYWLVFDRTLHTVILISVGVGLVLFVSTIVLVRRLNR
jgi:hypothetical protein